MNSSYEYRSIPWMDNASERMRSGQVLVRLESASESRLDLYNHDGRNLPAYLLYVVLKIALSDGWVERMEKLHQSRQNSWMVEVKLCPEIKDKVYRLYTLRDGNAVRSDNYNAVIPDNEDEVRADNDNVVIPDNEGAVNSDNQKPVCTSEIKVAINGLVNSFSILAEDIAPLLQRIIQDYPPILLPQYRNYLYNYCFPTYYPFYTHNLRLSALPDVISRQRQDIQTNVIDWESFQAKMSRPGQTSGIIETIEALKCMEVFLA